jgi:hypothetical protein
MSTNEEQEKDMGDPKTVATDVGGMEILFETSEVKPGDIVIDDEYE